MEPTDCKYYKEGTVCDRCTLEITKKDIEERWKALSNLEDAKTWEDIEFSCAQIYDALMYLVWDSPDDADFNKHERLVGGRAVITKFNKPGEPFKSWYEYNKDHVKTCVACGKKLNNINKSGYCRKHYYKSLQGKIAVKKYLQSDKGKAAVKRYNQSDKGKIVNRRSRKKYHKSPKGKATLCKAQKKYFKSTKGKAAIKRYAQSDKGKATRKKYDKSDKGKELKRKANIKYYKKKKLKNKIVDANMEKPPVSWTKTNEATLTKYKKRK